MDTKPAGFSLGWGVSVCACLTVLLPSVQAQETGDPVYIFSTLAGAASESGSVDGPGSAARFLFPTGVAVDRSGIVYVADNGNHTIRKITADGLVSTLAGRPGIGGWADGPGGAAMFRYPTGLAVDASGNVYVADSGNQMIRKVAPEGIVTTLAGVAGTSTFMTNGPGSIATFYGPRGVAVDLSGNVYVADTYDWVVRKISPEGMTSTYAGLHSPFNRGGPPIDGVGVNAQFTEPSGVAVDGIGNVYVRDREMLRKISSDLSVNTMADLGGYVDSFSHQKIYGFLGHDEWSVAVDGAGNALATKDSAIISVSPAGFQTVIAGARGVSGTADGAAAEARFNAPYGIAVDGSGNIYVADTSNHTIRKGWRHYLPAVPVLTTQPSGQSAGEGYPVTFVAGVAGEPVLTYQWFKDGVAILGATGSFYAISHVTAGDGGSYTVVAANANGSVTSTPAILTIVPAAHAPGQAGDFNGDGKADLIWSNSTTGAVNVGLMNGVNQEGGSFLGNFLLEWTVAATGDFNGDGMTDIVWSDSVTGERALWLMNGTNLLGISTLGVFPKEWTVVAVGDFNADGKPDIVWSNSLTGERALWLMNGTNLLGISTLGIFPKEWTVAAVGDFNGDSKPDIVWSNSLTGERALWLMDGTQFLGVSTLGIFPLEWTVSGVGDYNGDGNPDIIWSNSTTGEHALWFMNGTQFLYAASLGVHPLEWSVKN